MRKAQGEGDALFAEASVIEKESMLKPDDSMHSHSMADPADIPPDPPPDLQNVWRQFVRTQYPIEAYPYLEVAIIDPLRVWRTLTTPLPLIEHQNVQYNYTMTINPPSTYTEIVSNKSQPPVDPTVTGPLRSTVKSEQPLPPVTMRNEPDRPGGAATTKSTSNKSTAKNRAVEEAFARCGGYFFLSLLIGQNPGKPLHAFI